MSGKKPDGSGHTAHMQNPLFPTKSDWKPPRDFPDLRGADIIALDTETRDPKLLDKGPGVRRDGYIVGLSVAVPDGHSWYFPFDHAEGRQLDKEHVLNWARDNLCRPNQPKVGANILYDLDYLYHNGVKVSGPFYDVQNAEPLINENAKSFSLDTLAKKYLGEAKREKLLASACADCGLKGNPQQHIWRLDPKYVGPYAEGDAEQTLAIYQRQLPVLKEQGLEVVFDIETRLVPMLLHMRQLGVPVDVDYVTDLHEEMSANRTSSLKELEKLAGCSIDIWAAESIARVFDALGFSYPRTPKTKKPSFKKGWLEGHKSAIAHKIVECRNLDKFIGTFLEGSLLNMLVGDRIHCQFNQLRKDDSGTVTGRFSSSMPNLQFIPIRTELGKKIRGAFIPDPGYGWCKADYSQIEIRILVHYAALLKGKGAEAVVRAFRDNPNLDYHKWCADVAKISRTFAKRINFGLIYGMGVDKLADDLGIIPDEAKEFKRTYFEDLPFLKRTVQTATDSANARGYIKTILGRRRRFDLWEPANYNVSKLVTANPDKKKILQQMEYHGDLSGKLKRAGCFKAFNAADQGSAADIMKMAMVAVWEAGLCDVIKPYITVHDELDFGYPLNKAGEEAIRETKWMMEQVYQLAVPMVVDIERGPNWGKVK